jgi:hypothetical protein
MIVDVRMTKKASISTRQSTRAPRPELLPEKMRAGSGAAQAKPGPRGSKAPRPELLPAKMRAGPVGAILAKAERAPTRSGGTVARVINKSVVSNDQIFQQLLGVLGTDTILEDFAAQLGRSGCKVETKGKRIFRRPSGWEGLVFDGAHWKGYDDDGTVYDSYGQKLQLPGTNNFCQTYACYLWATKGAVPGLAQGRYADNIQYMSNLWLGYFGQVMKSRDTDLRKWLEDAAGGADTLKGAMDTLERLVKDARLAAEMSQSKE